MIHSDLYFYVNTLFKKVSHIFYLSQSEKCVISNIINQGRQKKSRVIYSTKRLISQNKAQSVKNIASHETSITFI